MRRGMPGFVPISWCPSPRSGNRRKRGRSSEWISRPDLSISGARAHSDIVTALEPVFLPWKTSRNVGSLWRKPVRGTQTRQVPLLISARNYSAWTQVRRLCRATRILVDVVTHSTQSPALRLISRLPGPSISSKTPIFPELFHYNGGRGPLANCSSWSGGFGLDPIAFMDVGLSCGRRQAPIAVSVALPTICFLNSRGD